MRIYLRTTPNDVIVPFDYQQKIVGTIHKWLGNNEIHDKISLYSFSWLLGGNMIVDKGYNFSKGATLFISFYENKYLKVLIDTILSDPKMFGERGYVRTGTGVYGRTCFFQTRYPDFY